MAAREEKIPIAIVRDQLKNEYGTTWMAYYDIRKPSSLPHPLLLLNNESPKVCLELVQPLDLPRLSAMQGINHRNIMCIGALTEVEIGEQKVKLLALFLDHHNGPLGVHLDSLQLHDNYGVVPSQALRDIIRQIICGVEELRINGFYHGDLSLINIFFSKRDVLLIKLFNFRTKDIPKENAQLEDCVAVGLILQQISNELKLRMPQLIFTLIDDLDSTLMASDVASLHTVKEIALKQIFFWEPRRRRIFWMHDVPKALEKHAADLIIRTHGWILPWNSRIHQGLLNEMNAYRRDEEERKNGGVKVKPEVYKYNVHDPLQYVKCISGAYTHADKLKARVGKILDNFGFEVTVDKAVQENDPELFIVLYKLLRAEVSGSIYFAVSSSG
ncbi:hypothetical protein ACQ4PT_032034 [Festuca glaucescens]